MAYPLPTVINPSTTHCVKVKIPNDPAYIKAFFGQLAALASHWSWDRDPDKRGKLAAERMLKMLIDASNDNCSEVIAGGEDMQFRQNGCKLEYSIDCETWYTLYDPTECINDAISHSSKPTGELPEGECVTYKRVVDAPTIFVVPTPVKAGYTVEILVADGAASDGQAPLWRCATGEIYAVGGCTPDTRTYSTTDPGYAAGIYHLAFMARIGNEIFPAWAGQSFTVPETIPNLTIMELLRNDAALQDDGGDTYVEVRICRPSGVGSGSGLEVVIIDPALAGEVTDLGNARFRVSIPWNNHPLAGDQPLTHAQIKLVNSDDTNVGAYWSLENMTGWQDVAEYTNNGAVFLDVYPNGPVLAPQHPMTPGLTWETWFNTNYAGQTVYAIDVRSTHPTDDLVFDVVISTTAP